MDLRPGSYIVTFTLSGFITVKREGLELTGSQVVAVNADMRVGAVAEIVTVTGETPVVDVRSVRRQTMMTNEVLTAIPSARAYGSIMLLVPSMITQGGSPPNVQTRPGMTVFGGAGGRNNEGRLQLDGLNVGASRNGGGVSGYNVDISNAQEVVFTTSGGMGEAEVGGPSIQVVPKAGGNTMKGSVYLSGANSSMVGSNYTSELQAAGLGSPGRIVKLWDYTVGVGGPIKSDRLWYFGQFRSEGGHTTSPNIFANRNAGDPTKWLVDLDRSSPGRGANSWLIGSIRLTAQATARNKFNVYWDEQKPCTGATFSPQDEGCRKPPESGYSYGAPFFGRIVTPEADGYLNRYQRVQQATWTSQMTNRLLLEAGFGTYISSWGSLTKPGSPVRDFIRVTEACSTAAGCAANGGVANLTYRSHEWFDDRIGQFNWRASASYITGSHSLKFGHLGGFLRDDETHGGNNHNLSYRFQNGVPDQLTQDLYAPLRLFRTRYDAFYGQEQWTRGRMTLLGALRYDYSRSYYPEQQVGPTTFLPNPLVFARTEGVKGWHDITPRGGLAYDLFGNGKTSLKVNFGKYLEAASNDQGLYSAINPTSRIAGSSALGAAPITRSWNDTNVNYVPDCDLLNNLAQDLRPSGGDNCGAVSDLNFGTGTLSNNFNPEILEGWGNRPSDWQFAASVQHELLPRISVEGTYTRRWLQNFFIDDNLAVTPADFGTFSTVAPDDPRLPEEARGRTITNLYNVNLDKFGQVSNYRTNSSDFGEQYQRTNGFSINVIARPRNSLAFQGGFGVGKTVGDTCEVRSELPELTTGGAGGLLAALVPVGPTVGPTVPWCHTSVVAKRATGLASYTIPKIEVMVSGTFRSEQGTQLNANFSVTSAAANAGGLGRPLAGNVPFVSVPLLEPGTLFGDRVNQIDFKVAKVLRFGRTRSTLGADIYNLTNSNAVLLYNQTFNPNVPSGPGGWLQPQGILLPRFFRLTAQIDF